MVNIVDDIAPVKVETVTGKQKALWKHNPTLKLLKIERKWRKYKLQVHYQIHTYSAAKQTFFSNIISRHINNTHVLKKKTSLQQTCLKL